ncbi:MAG: hypothetical protein V1799_12845 [bacterium]
MKQFFFVHISIQFLFGIVAMILTLAGCSTAPTVKEDPKSEPPPRVEAPRKPDMTVVLASLNLANRSTRFEKKDLQQLAAVLKKEQVEIFSVQNISRYPTLTNRLDFYDELLVLTDMRGKFGEMSNVSGRIRGNAVFSIYPTYGSKTTYFTGVRSANDEALLQVVIDAGVRTIGIVSAALPEKATSEEQVKYLQMIVAANKELGAPPLILSGNLPQSEKVRSLGAFTQSAPSGKKVSDNAVWYSSSGELVQSEARSIETALGTLLLARFGIFRQITNQPTR